MATTPWRCRSTNGLEISETVFRLGVVLWPSDAKSKSKTTEPINGIGELVRNAQAGRVLVRADLTG